MGQHPATVQSQRADLLRISIELEILVERFFSRIKHWRRVGTSYDELAANYLAFVQLASIRLWLRANESTS
jgi:transposase